MIILFEFIKFAMSKPLAQGFVVDLEGEPAVANSLLGSRLFWYAAPAHITWAV